jgi:hypothetical protein
MKIWIYRVLLFVLLFGLSALSYGGNQLNPLLDKVVNGITLIGIPAAVLFYFKLPGLYKVVAWVLVLGVILLILESMHLYNQYMYSYFVVKRFFYCGLCLSAYYIASQAGDLKIRYAVYVIFTFYVINQLALGHIFSYSLTSESRTTIAPESFYLIIPFLYYLVTYLNEKRVLHLLLALFTFGLIVFLLHRSVISAAVGAAGVVFGLAFVGKMPEHKLPVGLTLMTLALLLMLIAPFLTLLPERKFGSFAESISGMFSPKEDETGSWRYEQSQYYLSQIPERPLLGWRYEGYDRGEIMANEDFPDKGTIIHSQYIDMLYNYGMLGLGINLFIIIGTLITMYVRNRVFTNDQLVLFGFILSGLIYGISYQLPVYYWCFVGLGMYHGLKRPALSFSIFSTDGIGDPNAPSYPTELENNYTLL